MHLDSTSAHPHNFHGPAWDNSTEYSGLESSEFKNDIQKVEDLVKKMSSLNKELEPLFASALAGSSSPSASDKENSKIIGLLKSLVKIHDECETTVLNLTTFASAEYSIDTRSELNQKWLTSAMELAAKFKVVGQPFHLFLAKAPSILFYQIINLQEFAPYKFYFEQARKVQSTLLSEPVERTLAEFSTTGFSAWANLYKKIAGSLNIRAGSDHLSLSQAVANYFVPDQQTRAESWQGVQRAWEPHSISIASVLNSMAGWRLEEMKKRSTYQKRHYLDHSLESNRIERKTLNALMAAVDANVEVGRRAARTMAKQLNQTQLNPWDAHAPYPTNKESAGIPFAVAIDQVRTAMASMDPKMAEFIDLMVKNKWIEGRFLPEKAQGGYCTSFSKSRTPRVYITYKGSMQDVRTFAHELGHAYHSWLIRDLHLVEADYPMTLAETASIFTEYAWRDQLKKAANREELLAGAWSELIETQALLLNIPARFEFEKNFYERRQFGEVSVKELSELTNQAWKKYFGDTLTEFETLYWMSKQHFSFDYASFYNYPYTFGGLFALSIYARRKELGADFAKAYQNILLDTGRMTAENLILKHLGEDISHPDFWIRSIQIMDSQTDHFEQLAR